MLNVNQAFCESLNLLYPKFYMIDFFQRNLVNCVGLFGSSIEVPIILNHVSMFDLLLYLKQIS